MVLIFLSWIYILFTTINFGVVTDKFLALKNKNFVITSFLGLFSVTILASIWAFFGRINVEFHLVLLIFNFLIYFKLGNSIFQVYRTFFDWLSKLSLTLKLYLSLITVLIITQCSTLPYVIDNESYYIQTVKWLNEYGFVKGLINLHLFFGQTSGWHITQSVFNFSFLYENFNDLSGYIYLLGTYFCIEKLNKYKQTNSLHELLIGCLPLLSIFFFPFISSPSPDIPVYILSFIILFYFIENYKECQIETFNLIVVLILFMLYIKNTSFVFILIPPILLFKNYKNLHRQLSSSLAISTLVLILFVSKNLVISGSLIFPFNFFNWTTADYALPTAISDSILNGLRFQNFDLSENEFESLSALELFWHWLNLPKLTGLFNKISILLIFTSSILIYKYQNSQKYWIIYSLMVIQLVALFATSIQYRFYMNFLLFFSLFTLVCLVRNNKVITAFLFFSLLPVTYFLVTDMNLNSFTDNKLMSQTAKFQIKSLVFPKSNSKINTDFEKIELGNLKYNSPIQNDFFYGTGNGDLPCVNKDQVEYYRKSFNVIPQMRTNELKDGFYSKNLNPNE